MANPIPVQLVVSGDTSNLAKQLADLQKQIQQINGAGSGGGGLFDSGTKSAETFQQSLRGLIGRFSALWAVMKSGEGLANIFGVGVQFNAAIQDARLGIGSLITAQAKVVDSTGAQMDAQQSLTAAMAMGDDQIQKLRISGLQTAATTEQLVSAYQDAVGGGLRAGMSLDQIRQLTVQTVQAAGAMGVPMNQLNQEIRSILDGTIDRNSRVAIRLGITNADVAKWKEAGTLFEKLHERMGGFSEAGKESMKNWTVLLSNMAEASQILLGDAFKNPMANIQASLNSVMSTIINIETANISEKVAPVMMMLKDLGNLLGDFAVSTIRAIVGAIQGMGEWWAKNREAITETVVAFKTFLGDSFSFLGSVAVGMIKFLAECVLLFGKLPEPIKAASIAAGAFAIAMWAANSALAVGAANGATMLISGLQKLGMVFAVATTGAQGFSVALTAMGGPVVWLIAALAAIAAGFYYVASSGVRASQAMLEAQRQSGESVTSLVGQLSTLKAIDEEMKKKDATTAEVISREAKWKESVDGLIKQFPDMAEMIKFEIQEGRTLAQIWMDIANEKVRALKVDIAAQELALQKKKEKFVDQNPNVTKALDFVKDRATMHLWSAGKAVVFNQDQKALAIDQQRLEAAREILKPLEARIAVQKKEAILVPNLVDSDKKKKELADQAHALAELNLLIEKEGLRGMEKATDLERESLEIANAKAHTKQLILQAEKLAEAAKTDPKESVAALKAAGEDVITRIQNEHIEKRMVAAQRWYDFVHSQEGDTLERKLSALKIIVDREADSAERITGIKISAADRDKVLAERSDRETVAFREQRIKQLETAMASLAREEGALFTIQDMITKAPGLGEKLRIEQPYIDAYVDKLKGIGNRQNNWYAGMAEGLDEVANSVTDRFKLMKDAVTSVAQGMKSAFSTAIAGMLQGSMNLSQGLKSIWKGIVSTIIGSIAELVAKFIVAQIAQAAFSGIMAKTAVVTSASLYELAVMETWAAYAGIPFAWPIALAQIGMITASYLGAKGMGMGATAGNGASLAEGGEDTGTAVFTGAAVGGLFSKPTATIFGEAGRELAVPETTFLDWIKNVGERAISMPMGGFTKQDGSQLAFAGGGGNHVTHASFDGALIIGDSTSGLKKAAKALRTIRNYDDRMNG